MSKKKGIFTVALIVLFTIFIGYVDIFGFGTSKAGSAKTSNWDSTLQAVFQSHTRL